jgi:hypothetical protein
VVDGPGPDYRLDRVIGWRTDRRSGVAVCVHPYRVGIAPGRYVSGGQALPAPGHVRPAPSAAALRIPEDVTDLEGWLVAVLRVADPDTLFDTIEAAERVASARFAPAAVTTALRRVLSRELAHHEAG